MKMAKAKEAQLQWVTVSLNEASIDSPSFRAYVNYYNSKVDELTDWIHNYGQDIEAKYKKARAEVSVLNKSLTSHLLPTPSILNNGFAANQTYAAAIAYMFGNDYADFTKNVSDMLYSSKGEYDKLLKELNTNAIEPYAMRRKNFDYYQSRFDTMLSETQSLEKSSSNMNPGFLKNEALQMFEVKKNYLDASLTLIRAISHFQLSVDRFISDIMSKVNERNKFPVKRLNRSINLAPDMNYYIEDYSKWIDIVRKYAENLTDNLEQAHKFIYGQSLTKIAPSDNIKDYDFREGFYSKSPMDCSGEERKSKAGWLYMKTFIGTDNKEIWVRRWCFVDDLIFGIFVLSPGKKSVEETDKFGMKLLTVKYLDNVPQRFAFELRIKNGIENKEDLLLTFQAENLPQLKEWINTFKHAKQKYLDMVEDKKDVAYAERRYSPRFYEFASSTTTLNDQLLVTFDKKGSFSLIENLKKTLKTKKIETMLEQKNFNYRACSSPISTELSALALLSGAFKNPHKYYEATQANIWGVNTINQNGGVYLREGENDNKLAVPYTYPSSYPDSLKVANIQFKTIFESINYEKDEKILQNINEPLLFKYSAIWVASKAQKFASLFHVTQRHIYVYMSFLGFSHLSRNPISNFVSVEYDDDVKDVIKMYTSDGFCFKFIVCFANYKAVATKLQYLLESDPENNRKSVSALLKKFNEIDNVFKEEENIDKACSSGGALSQTEYDLGKTFWRINVNSKKMIDRCKNIRQYYTKTHMKAYDISSKALTHIMFGDQSNVFPDCLFFADRSNNYNTNWYWKEEKDSKGASQFVRNIQFKLNRTDGFLSENSEDLSTKQRIVRMIENRYYEIDQDPIVLKIPLCHPLKIACKFIITEPADPISKADTKLQLSTSRSILFVNYKLEFMDTKKLCFTENIVSNLVVRFTALEFAMMRRAIHYYIEKIGSHGKTVKATQLCGMLGVVLDNDTKEREDADMESLNSNDESNSSMSSESIRGGASRDAETNISKKATYDVKYTLSLALRVAIKMMLYRIIGLFLGILKIIFMMFSFVSNVWGQVNKLLLLGLIISIIFNLFLSGRSTVSFWSVKKANNIFDDLMNGKNRNTMERAIYIKDLDLLQESLSGSGKNSAFQKFNEDLDVSSNKYRESRRDLALKRNDLLVELSVLQNLEKQLVNGDYKQFLIKEIEKCRRTKSEYSRVWEKDQLLRDYCSNCSVELEKLGKQFL